MWTLLLPVATVVPPATEWLQWLATHSTPPQTKQGRFLENWWSLSCLRIDHLGLKV